ncbi:MAG: SprT-like domain-containing protein [Oscillospiraceae bacterium]|nr:SprT-like domain-containing protein [Oscillospiraceae bacterium]
MKETTKMSRAVGQLEKMYNTMNADFYDGALPVPIITVQSKPGTWGHCTTAKVWKRKDGGAYEMNIAAEVLDREIEEIIDTILHEMVHLYCRENNIKEVSRGGKYHNGKFKELAERCGLKCVKAGQYGWNTTAQDNDRLTEYALEKGWSEIKISRGGLYGLLQGLNVGASGTPASGPALTGGKRPSSTRKYVCPCCGMSVRATRDVNIMCGDCHETMTKE